MTGVAAYFAAVEAPYTLALKFGDVPVAVRTNHAEVQARLRRYFSPFVVSGVGDERAEITLIQGSVEPQGSFLDLQRGPGKRLKEAVQEVSGGRLILKSPLPIVHKVLDIGGLATLVDGNSPDGSGEPPRAARPDPNGAGRRGER